MPQISITLKSGNISTRYENQLRLVFQDDYLKSTTIALPNSREDSNLFKQVQSLLSEALLVEKTDKIVSNNGLQKLDIGSPRGSGFRFTQEIDVFTSLNAVRQAYFINHQWEINSHSLTEANAFTPYLQFEMERLKKWQTCIEQAAKKKQDLLDMISRAKESNMGTAAEQFKIELKRINNFLTGPYSTRESALKAFLGEYLAYETKITAQGVTRLFEQLSNSDIFTKEEIKAALASQIDTSKEPGDKNTFAYQFYNTDRYAYNHATGLGKVWQAIVDLFRRLFSKPENKSRLFTQPSNTDLAKDCYKEAVMAFNNYVKENNPIYLEQAAEWVSRGSKQDNGDNFLKCVFGQLKQIKQQQAEKYVYFIRASVKKSASIALLVLDDLKTHMTCAPNPVNSMDLYTVIHDAPWDETTAIEAIDKIAKMEHAKELVNLNVLHNCFYKTPRACTRLLRYDNLMSSVCYGPQDIGSILNDSAKVLIEDIEAQNEPSIELINYIRYAESTDLSDYNKKYSGLRGLPDKHKELIQVIAEKAKENDSFKSLLKKIFKSETPFIEGIEKNELISSILTI